MSVVRAKRLYKDGEIDQFRYRKLLNCGRSTVFLQDADGKIFATPNRCKDHLCHSCGSALVGRFREQLLYYSQTLSLRFFFTLTCRTGVGLDVLRSAFSDIREEMASLHFPSYERTTLADRRDRLEGFARKKGLPLEEVTASYAATLPAKWAARLEGIIDHDTEHMFRLGMLAFNVWLIILEDITRGTLPDRGGYSGLLLKQATKEKVSSLKRDYQKEADAHISAAYAEYRKGAALYRGRDCYLRKEDGRQITYADLRSFVEGRVRAGVDSPFSYISVKEHQKNGAPHFHILGNHYFSFKVVGDVLKRRAQDGTLRFEGVSIFQCDDLLESLTHSDSRNGHEAIADYVTKYLTKDTLQESDGLSGLVDSSRNISLTLRDDRGGKTYRYLKTAPFLARSSWEHVDGDLAAYISGLQTKTDDYNACPHVSALQRKEHEGRERLADFLKGKDRRDAGVRDAFAAFKEQAGREMLAARYEEQTRALFRQVDRHLDSVVKCPALVGGDAPSSPEMGAFLSAMTDPRAKFVFLVGSAGTGKTTLLSSSRPHLDYSGLSVGYCAYTGKAASRISEVLGDIQAMTIHRMASARFSQIADFHNDERNPLPYDVVFVDEVSMLCKMILSMLLGALPLSCKIVLIGDRKQLLPVNSGCVIDEFRSIESASVRFVELVKNHRSGGAVQGVIDSVLAGSFSPDGYFGADLDFVYEKISQGWQVVCNSNRLVKKVNAGMQKKIATHEITKTAHYRYNVGDRVLILKNDKREDLYNGDFAEIVKHNDDGVFLKKGDRVSFYDYFRSATAFVPSHAITVHKSQGSQFGKVLVLLEDREFLLNQNILYTAVSRAEHAVEVWAEGGTDVSRFFVPQATEDPWTLSAVDKERREKGAPSVLTYDLPF